MVNQFIFSRNNRWLKKYYELWKKKKAFGIYILIGPSGSGKSLFLKQLVDELEGEYCTYTGQEIASLLLNQVRKNENIQIQAASIMIFEDIDCLIKNASMKAQFEALIKQYLFDESGAERLILMTSVDFMAFQLLGYAIPVNPLKVNWSVVRKKAREYQVKLSMGETWKLSRYKRISEVEAELRKLKMLKEM